MELHIILILIIISTNIVTILLFNKNKKRVDMKPLSEQL
jgi:hypothetical protein